MDRAILITLVLVAAAATGTAQKPPEPTPTHPEVRAELLQRKQENQRVRKDLVEFMKTSSEGPEASKRPDQRSGYIEVAAALMRTDRENTSWLKTVVQRHGWPTRSMVGVDGSDAAWLLAQSADSDRHFQRYVLDLMIAQPADQVPRTHVALLTDRLLVKEGKLQRYGTQVRGVNGELVLCPVEDPDNLEARRKEMGLPTVAESMASLRKSLGLDD